MAEYIDRERARNEFAAYFRDSKQLVDDCDDLLCHLPTADVVEVRHGKWRFVGQDSWNDTYECSLCRKMATDDSEYCPNCGAKMDGKGEDE